MHKFSLLVAAMALALAGCAGDASRSSSEADSGGVAGGQSSTETSGIDTSGTGDAGAGTVKPVDAAPEQPTIDISQRVVHFDFDSSAIKAADLPTISAHARHLALNPSVRVRLEGHADERGTREYNIALGERRANAVRDALLLRGASARQITVISYGEERPVDEGHNEQAWARNRRVEFVY